MFFFIKKDSNHDAYLTSQKTTKKKKKEAIGMLTPKTIFVYCNPKWVESSPQSSWEYQRRLSSP